MFTFTNCDALLDLSPKAHSFMTPRQLGTPIIRRAVVGLFSVIAGAIIVLAGFTYRALNWIVDGPGWIVSRFVSVDFHEGDGAFGFFLAVLLAWACAALSSSEVTS